MSIDNIDSSQILEIKFSDSLDSNNPFTSINSNKNKINFEQFGECPVKKIYDESAHSNQIYKEYAESGLLSEEQNLKSALSESMEEEYDDNENDEENHTQKCDEFNTQFNQSQIKEITGEGISPEVNKVTIQIKTKGRPSKNNPRKEEIVHTRQSLDNATKVFIQKCVKNLHQVLQNLIKTLIVKKRKKNQKKINGKLHVPTINDYLTKNYEKKNLLFNTSIQQIYYNTRPKRLPNNFKKDKDKYCYNKEVLKGILAFENENEQIEVKVLNMIFNCEFKLFLIAFLNDKKFVTINGIKIELENFETFSDCYNKGEKGFPPELKIDIKNYVNDMMSGKLKTRKPRKKIR